MKTKEKSLQKFTGTEEKIEKLLALKQITQSDIGKLTVSEQNQFFKVLNQKAKELKDTARDNFFKKIEPITSESTKNQLWESNHVLITATISNLLIDFGRMPANCEIAEKTGLSRQTVHKHLKEYASHPQYLEQVEQFRLLTARVLSQVFKFAIKGDVAAAKLYINAMGNLNGQAPGNTLIQNQNNYIQINGTVLSQEVVRQLKPEQLNTIETILKEALYSK